MGTFDRFRKYLCAPAGAPLQLDISRMDFADGFFDAMEPAMQSAYAAMDALEAGAIANPDENRMVGHYWLRAPERSPAPDIAKSLTDDLGAVLEFAGAVHRGEIVSGSGAPFQNLLVIGIGGSALGPQLLADALRDPAGDRLRPYFFDNTDPDGMARTLGDIGAGLDRTLFVVISKSGSTPEPRNGMIVAEDACRRAGIDFGRNAAAVTGAGSHLDQYARQRHFLARFPMYDFIGGRTSLWCPVGLLPAALQGLDVKELLRGAREMDALTRSKTTRQNPAALLALMWHHGTGGAGKKDMVVLPYADRLLLFSRYLQQLVMESLGKERDLGGDIVHQGIAVYGNKGSTDQHAYVQQLRDGVPNFFAVFIEALDKGPDTVEVEPGVTSGDYLNGFLLGTREALHENGRQSMTISLDRVDAHALGALIAMFERAVGFYASLVGINAYHQPGVEAGKKAAARVLKLQAAAVAHLRANSDSRFDADAVASAIGAPDAAETVFLALRHLAACRRGVSLDADGCFKATVVVSQA